MNTIRHPKIHKARHVTWCSHTLSDASNHRVWRLDSSTDRLVSSLGSKGFFFLFFFFWPKGTWTHRRETEGKYPHGPWSQCNPFSSISPLASGFGARTHMHPAWFLSWKGWNSDHTVGHMVSSSLNYKTTQQAQMPKFLNDMVQSLNRRRFRFPLCQFTGIQECWHHFWTLVVVSNLEKTM